MSPQLTANHRAAGSTPARRAFRAFRGAAAAVQSAQPAEEEGMPGTVGFIGLGAMGGPMALNVARRGFDLVVHDLDPAKTAPLRAGGARVAESAEGATAERTICMVETEPQVEAVAVRRARRRQGRAAGAHRRLHEHDRPACGAPLRRSPGGAGSGDAGRAGQRRHRAGAVGRAGGHRRRRGGDLCRLRGPVPRHGHQPVPCRAARQRARHEAGQQHADPGQHGRRDARRWCSA